MRSHQEDYSRLPKRCTNRNDGSFDKLRMQTFSTNYFTLQLNPIYRKAYQFDYKLYDQQNTLIEFNSQLYRKFVQSTSQQLRQKIGYEIQRGQIIIGIKNVEKVVQKCTLPSLEGDRVYQAIIRKTKQIDIRDMIKSNCGSEMHLYIMQLLNIYLKKKLIIVGFTQLGKTGKFFAKDCQTFPILKDEDGNQQFNLKKGYKIKVVSFKNDYALQIDTCFRLLKSISFRQQLRNELKVNKKSKDQINRKFTGESISLKYGTNFRNYVIEEIDWLKTPKSTFIQDDNSQISYIEYYKKHHNIKINDEAQPLIKVVLKTQQKINVNGTKQKVIKYGYLIPELVCLASLDGEGNKKSQVTAALTKWTKQSPEDKMQSYRQLIQKINVNKEWMSIEKQIKLEGYILGSVYVQYKNCVIETQKNGKIGKLQTLKQAANFNNFFLVYSTSQKKQPKAIYQKQDDQDIYQIMHTLKQASRSYGIKIEQGTHIKITPENDIKQWENRIKQEYKHNNQVQIIILILKKKEQYLYSKLKQYIIKQLDCPSQVIRKQTLFNPRSKMSAASKIVIQMNVKIGLAPWQIQKSHCYFQNHNVMYGGVATSKGKNGSFLSFVGSINNSCTNFYGKCQKISNNAPISDKMLLDIFSEWAKQYFIKNNRKVPDAILLFREGLNQTQADSQIQSVQIPAMEKLIDKIKVNTKVKNYKPDWQIITVNKRINSRIFSEGRRQNQELINPRSGTLITQSLSESDTFDLIPQQVTQGTATPTRFRTVVNNTDMSKEALISFIFEQCFNYYNWEGAVRVPACLQYANKLGKFMSQNIKTESLESGGKNLMFYL